MKRLLEAYRALHAQAFVPIFAVDRWEPQMLLEACLEAGLRVIEYTLRRPEAARMIPWIRQHHPELILLVGSTLDDPDMVRLARRRHPQLLTLEELAAMGVDGFVSLTGFAPRTIEQYASTHLVIPAAMTVREAWLQAVAGAHFIKLLGPDLTVARLCGGPGSHQFAPLLMTGGMTADRLAETIAAGVHVVGCGFELLLKDQVGEPDRADVARALARHVQIAQNAQRQTWPALAQAAQAQPQAWLESLPHNHPF